MRLGYGKIRQAKATVGYGKIKLNLEVLNPHRAGGVWTYPKAFRKYVNSSGAQKPVHTVFSTHDTISNPGHSMSGHQVTSSNLNPEKG